MPVGGVSRSQTVHSNEALLTTVPGIASFFVFEPTEFTPERGEFISAVPGTFNPEPEKVKRGGALEFFFIPSHLRTKYAISYFTATLPPVIFVIPKTKEEIEKGEWEFELGFLTVVRISGLPYFASPVGAELFTLSSAHAKGNSFTVAQRTQQISLVETITAIPGGSIELEVIPFIRVVRVISSAALDGVVALAVPPSGLSGGRVMAAGVMVYEQQFEQKG